MALADHRANLLRVLRVQGPQPARVLGPRLGLSQPTLSRALADLSDVVVIGRARATRYAARRTIDGVPASVPCFELGEGAPQRLGWLHPIAPAGFWFESDGPLGGVYPDLPWFLDDLRPRGFLGRQAPAQVPELRLPPDVRDWSGDQVLRWLVHAPVEVLGSLMLGDAAVRRSLGAAALREAGELAEEYADWATAVLSDGLPGSSAAGEQPKFLAARGGVPVLVKFSPSRGSGPAGERVAALLRAEHLALTSLREEGVPAAESRVLEVGGRTFLEVDRFDRLRGGARAGFVSCLALDSAFVGDLHSWTDSTAALVRLGRVPDGALPQVAWLDQFGAGIGNTDRHGGNLSFRFERGRVLGLAPVYDMLPMAYMPRAGELPDRPFPLPERDFRFPAEQRSALTAALRYWRRVEREVPPLASIATEAVARLHTTGLVSAG